MANAKRYLDFPGLSLYDRKIKELIKSGDSALEIELKNIIHQLEQEDLDRDAALALRIAAIENNIGDITALGDDIQTLVEAIIGESSRAQKAEEDLRNQINNFNFTWGTLGQE